MKRYIYYMLPVVFGMMCTSCSRRDFLNEKMNSTFLIPTTLGEFQALLDYSSNQSHVSALPIMSDDDIYLDDAGWKAATYDTERFSYRWDNDIYGGDADYRDWSNNYATVFYANNVLEGIQTLAQPRSPEALYVRGQALFKRAYAFYDLARNYSPVYDAATAATDLGIPLRVHASVANIVPRASVQETYDRIFADLAEARELLPAEWNDNLYRPTKIAVDALLARICLDMRNYPEAEKHVTSCLAAHDYLLDYNTVDLQTVRPFTINNQELIYSSMTVGFYYATSSSAGTYASVSPELLGLYEPTDLRLPLFFNPGTDGAIKRKNGYYGTGSYPFTGLATDEMYLIKAECLARRDDINAAMDTLNSLLKKRYDQSVTYVPRVAADKNEALQQIWTERRKELTGRALRWQDLKRLNKEGAGIVLRRMLEGVEYVLQPNDPRYIFPIHPQEISLSGIDQNLR